MNYDSISPVAGRYGKEAESLAQYMTERALVEERVRVELAYLSFLVKLDVAPNRRVPKLSLSIEKVKSMLEKGKFALYQMGRILHRRLTQDGPWVSKGGRRADAV